VSSHPFDPLLAVRTLQKHGVRFVVIGGFASRLWGSPTLTNDLDLCYARDQANLVRLATALKELEASLRGAPSDLPFLLDARTLEAGDHFTFETLAGNLDVLGLPAGVGGFDPLLRNATEMEIARGLRLPVASLDDLITMKRAAGRPKDLIEVEILSALREEIERA
jgi:predicted nucleotidyltransferase